MSVSSPVVVAWFVGTVVLPSGIALIVAWRFWPLVGARLREIGVLARPAAPEALGRLEVFWYLAAVGILGSGLAMLVAPLVGGLASSWSAVANLVRYGDWGGLPVVGAALVGVAFELVVLVAVCRGVRWSRVRARFAIGPSSAFRPLTVIGLVPWWAWPMILLGFPLRLVSALELARMAVVSTVPFTLGALVDDPAAFFVAYGVTVDAIVSGVAALAAYGYALWVALGIVSWFERGHRPYFRTRTWLADMVVVVTLTGLLGHGLEYVLEVATSILFALVTAWLGSGGAIAAASPLPACVARPGASMGVVLVWILLPLLALPIARRLMAMVSEEALIRHVGWFPSGREARLLWLTLATALVWPYMAVEQACALGLIGNVPGYVVLGIAALVAVLAVTVVVRPASEKES